MMRQFHRVCFVGAKLLSRIFLLAIVAWGAFSIEGHKLCAQNLERLSRYEETLYGEKIFVNGDYRMMCDIRTYWSDMVVKKLESSARHYDFALTGNSDGVLRVSSPASVLFHACDTTLTGHADGYLYPFVKFLKESNSMATLIIACHTDNNGSPVYLERFSKSRASAIAAWFARQSVSRNQIACYGVADHAPLCDNESLKSREKNRRVTLYFVPNKNMLRLARKGRLLNSAKK